MNSRSDPQYPVLLAVKASGISGEGWVLSHRDVKRRSHVWHRRRARVNSGSIPKSCPEASFRARRNKLAG